MFTVIFFAVCVIGGAVGGIAYGIYQAITEGKGGESKP
jgi:hypothetical protein